MTMGCMARVVSTRIHGGILPQDYWLGFHTAAQPCWPYICVPSTRTTQPCQCDAMWPGSLFRLLNSRHKGQSRSARKYNTSRSRWLVGHPRCFSSSQSQFFYSSTHHLRRGEACEAHVRKVRQSDRHSETLDSNCLAIRSDHCVSGRCLRSGELIKGGKCL